MSMIKDYQGFNKTLNSSGSTVEETYKGFKDDCINFMASYYIGQTSVNGYGTLRNI
jgi:hypothetical protein